MTTHQTVFLFLDLAVVVALARLVGALARRLGQPAVIGEILAGVLIGPSLLGTGVTDVLFPADVRPLLSTLANVGVAVFMFGIGVELDRALLRGKGKLATAVSLASIALPFALGALLALYLVGNHTAPHRLGFVLFIGAAMSVTAFPVLARILADRGLSRTPVGGIALVCAAAGDLLAWCLLAVVVLVSGGGGQWLFLWGPAYLVVMLWLVRPLLRKVLTDRVPTSVALSILIAGLLLSGAATEWIGLHFIFGAFLFGVVVPHEGTSRLRESVVERIDLFNGTLLLPVFFIVAGLKVDLSAIGATGVLELALVLVAAVTGKLGGAFAAARLNGMPTREAAGLGVLMNTRGLTELIILSVGLRLGMLDQRLYSVMVVMAIVTTAMAGPLLRLLDLPTDPPAPVHRPRTAAAAAE
ncbi:cation:proton antiporter [Actinokineospora auranticolor]|uniref:Kef-type K+ transport system membrane component KefB n=1 Tax=Actinokineospora auranticolor TaxID=155976 RepID=A0A2S6GIN9_9PSEU|nr:cation:proton antiporter [Actinokineospora auranticolor]PPK65021.1 Kef-type K+ transport system membrane component KefB [Actinokineospora auranticolor]